MGQDKAALVWQGRTLLTRIAQTARDVAPHVLVAGRPAPTNWAVPDTTFLPDARPGEGPLRGLEAALLAAAPAAVLLVACDMPLLSADALRWLLALNTASLSRPADPAVQDTASGGLAVQNQGRWEPLFSVYRAACLPAVQARLARGQRSLHRLIESSAFALAEAPPWVCAQLVNVNTPADLAALPQ